MQPWPNSSLKLTFSQFGIGGKQPILVLHGQTLLQCKQTINLLCIYNNCSKYKYIWDGLLTNITFNFVLTRNFTVPVIWGGKQKFTQGQNSDTDGWSEFQFLTLSNLYYTNFFSVEPFITSFQYSFDPFVEKKDTGISYSKMDWGAINTNCQN